MMMSKHFPFVKVWKNLLKQPFNKCLGLGFQVNPIPSKVNLWWFLLFTYASAYLYLGCCRWHSWVWVGIPDPTNSCRYSKGDCYWVGGRFKLCSVTKIHLPQKLVSYFVGKCIYLTKLNSPYTKTLGQYTSSLRIKVPMYFSSNESQVLLCQENLLSKVTVLDQKRQDLSRTIHGCSWCRDVEDRFNS